MEVFNVGILGFGFMGKMHAYGYKTIPLYYGGLPWKTKLCSVCTSSPATAQIAKEAMDFEFATVNPDDIINREDIHIINVCTPNIYHKDVIIKALKAGKHIYCDKPLAINYEEAQEIVKVMKENKDKGSVCQVVFQNRFFPATLKAKELIEEGRLGNVLTFRASYLHSGSVDPIKPIGWKQDKDIGGGGVLLDLGSHILDLIYYLLGEYRSVFAKTQVLYPKRPDKKGVWIDISAEDAVYMVVKMKNNGIGTIEASKIATGTDDELRFEIHGDKGALRFNLMNPNYLEFYDNTAPEGPYGGMRGFTRIECVQRYPKPGGAFPSPKASIGWMRAHVHCLYSFLDSVYNKKQAYPSFEDGAYIQYVMEKAYESDEKQCLMEI
jgi:predicted dehydrogenase